MFKFDELAAVPKLPAMSLGPSRVMLDEIHDHLVFVLKEKLGWLDASKPEMSVGGGHVVIRFERGGQRFVFRVAKHGLHQHKRTMLAYQHVGHLAVIPEKIYHDGISLLERHADGFPLNTQVSDSVLMRLAQTLSKLHAMPTQGFGPLVFDTQGAFPDAAAYYHAQQALELDWAEADLSDEHAQEMMAALLDANTMPPALMQAPVHLGHGDLWSNNILVTAADFKILDWDRIGAYPLERDLAFLLELGLSESQRNMFFSHYSQRDSVNPQLVRWLAKRRVMRDRGVRLSKKLAKIRAIDEMVLAKELN